MINKVTVPVIDLAQQYKALQNELEAAMRAVIESTAFILGPAVADFETELAKYCMCTHAVGVASGTDALLLSLIALGVKAGDEVITTPFTFVATANTIIRAGAVPVFVDIDAQTYNIDVSQVEAAITPRTKVIIPVHLYGQPSNMKAIREISKKHGLVIIEDAAQAIGARYAGRIVGYGADAIAISFYPTKNLGAYGDGGAVVTNRPDVAENIDILRRQGGRKKYWHDQLGFNSRLDSIQAAILSVKLKYLDDWNAQRRTAAYRYNRLLEDTEIITPYEMPDVYHVYHQYTIRVSERRDELQRYLLGQGVETAVYYPVPLHRQPLFKHLSYRDGQLPVADKVCSQVLSLPCFPEISENQQQLVIDLLRSFYYS